MNNIISHFATLVFVLFALYGCEVFDPCENQVCLNGGDCIDGDCICINGFTGEHCEIEPPQADCVVKNTSELCITNSSTVNKTYDIVLDGILIMTIAPGSTECRIVSAGQHDLNFYFTNTSTKACTTSQPILSQCGTHGYFCTG